MNLKAAITAALALREDASLVRESHRRRGAKHPDLSTLADTSMWALGLIRTSAMLRASVGSSLGLSTALRLVFHIDMWTDDVGPGLRLPHPFNVVVGEGVTIGSGCTLMHNVTVQRGAGTHVGNGVVLGVGSTVLAGSTIGDDAVIGAASVVRGAIPATSVAVGAPARVIRKVHADKEHP